MAITNPNTTLRDEQQLIASMLELMKQEQQFLVSADTDGLAALTPQKSQLIHQMAALSGQRQRSLGAAGFSASEAGMEPWLDAAGDADARAQWQGLLELTRAAKELNRVNGMLINKQMVHNQTVLNAMRAPAAGGDSGFYGPSGQTVSPGLQRKFVVG
jgi:flagella synthesis protein FlgN